MAIHIYGTSHVSEQSLELIEEKIEEHDPEIVALELDMIRLNSLLSEQQRSGGGPLFVRLLKMFQDMVGSKTGVMPGEEMLYGYEKAVGDGREVALIDQDITETVQNLKEVKASEKIKALAQIFIGVLLPGAIDFDYSEIPDDRFIDELLYEFKFKFPEMHEVLVEQRNIHMAGALKKLQQQNPDADIVAFVGAAHKKALREMIETDEVDS